MPASAVTALPSMESSAPPNASLSVPVVVASSMF